MGIMGGGERVAIHSIMAALSMGHEVALLSEQFDTKRFEDFFGCYGLLSKVDRISYPEFRPRIASSALLYQRLYYYQRQFRATLSRGQLFDLALGTQDVGYVPTVRAPVVQYCYFPEYFSHLQSASASPLWNFYYMPARLFYKNRVKHIDKFLAVSDYTRRFVKKTWRRDSITVYPPCPVEIYKSYNQDRENLAVTVGRIVPEKRMHLFLDMAKKLPNIQFVIIGSVTSQNERYHKFLTEKSPSNLSILLSPLRKARDILTKAKVYVHCAEGEHFGITIVEAMASGCVPVVHDSGGPREIVTREVGFRWTETTQAADQISKLMENEPFRTKLSEAASVRANTFSTEAYESTLTHELAKYGF